MSEQIDWKQHADNLANALTLALDGSGPDEPVWAEPAFRALHHYRSDAEITLLRDAPCQCPEGWVTANYGWHRGPNACPRFDLDQRERARREAARPVVCQGCGLAHDPDETERCIEGHGSDGG